MAPASADLAEPAQAAAPRPAAAHPVLPDPIRITPPPGTHVFAEPERHASQQSPVDATMPRPGMGGDPDWLTERLARDAALNSRSEWSGRWSRRIGAWGAAGVLLALLAGGGFWLYQQSEVEGALVVVANTNPSAAQAPASVPAPAQPALVRTTPALPASGNPAAPGDSTNAALPAAPTAAAGTAPPPAASPSSGAQDPAGVGATGGVAGPSTAAAGGDSGATSETTAGSRPAARETPEAGSPIEGADRKVVAVPVADEPAASPAKRQRSHAKKRAKPEARAAQAEREPSARQRREETLMQCRAHGYDERQCLQRGCEMTRFGFACKG